MSKITIVGGGLVGSLLAIVLAKRGHVVSVYELSLIHISEPTRPY